jgi:nitrogen-specific signal transduction histidine kinase
MENYSAPQIENGKVTGIMGIARNITERKVLEEQLKQSQKMEAMGTLVGGIAHDFNNILTAIVGYATLAQQKLAKDDPCGEYLGHVLDAGGRASRLTQSLLAYSRKQVSNPVTVDLNSVVSDAERLLKRLVPESIEFTLTLTTTPLSVKADAGQIDQILMNLIANARDAIHGTGKLHIATDTVLLTPADAARVGNVPPGSYAVLSVADTGMGMGGETRKRIFEPFFTTKEAGRGTGLGLSMVYGIVQQHNGVIDCQSEPGRGTVFTIYLPLIGEEVTVTPPPAAEPAIGGDETILLVEDDEGVRSLTKRLLEESGYRVIVAVDGEEAVAKFTAHQDEVQLTILDVIMPKLGGKDVCHMIFECSREAKILFVSGYTADIMPETLLINDRCAFLPKPIKPSEFLSTVRASLDS